MEGDINTQQISTIPGQCNSERNGLWKEKEMRNEKQINLIVRHFQKGTDSHVLTVCMHMPMCNNISHFCTLSHLNPLNIITSNPTFIFL